MAWIQSTSEQPRVGNAYLVRGFIGAFSSGIDELNVRIGDQGIRSHVYQEVQDVSVAEAIVKAYEKAPRREPLCLIGHSFGADDVIKIARELDKHNIPVDVLITIDPTQPPKVPKNVRVCWNYYQPSVWDGTQMLRGIAVETEPEFNGTLLNMNIRKEYSSLLEWDTNHINIDKNKKIHADIIKRLEGVCIERTTWLAGQSGGAERLSSDSGRVSNLIAR